jgi:hypothetical protein
MAILLILIGIGGYIFKIGMHYQYMKQVNFENLSFKLKLPDFWYLLIVFLFPIFKSEESDPSLNKYRLFGNIAYLIMFVFLILFVFLVDNKII